ncbi:PREDICTED: uncharacterized protein LOC109345174 [Lupinus angustifolius]|uniref:uncharacterized protein LOC109345174 n=1 Tax=Lupinus angustifolius TaxID=3871 RepID=UPI00092E3810|nr:PREDICTED: uncharacterized protein LOC109345174 [Lupinus angustifolius]XP_019439548.1 PREDICTED: uncharacterized protein LOC109345174 [Lupinus angustifolius]XP_019439549.1 PREDICTED: uncharacterized protein LOC109345174 [Lupinus angustifolius]XP_019439550.1 PREDICTED: uncharacterized protein LOC109345174 [Lupinus angustifolius]
MALLGRSSSGAFTLLLLGLFFMYKLNLALASSGGVMGGGFFHSDDSSSSESFTSDSETGKVLYDSPPSRVIDDASGSHGGGLMLFVVFTFGVLLVGFCRDTNGNTVTVLKLQAAMLGGIGSSIQRDLAKIAEDADTSSKEGVINLLTETIQVLHQHPTHCIAAGYSFVDLKQSREDGEKCYNQLSNEERAKFDEETLINLNKERKSTRSQGVNMLSNEYNVFDAKKSKEEDHDFEEEKLLNGLGNEYIVITILVATKGAYKLPNIHGAEDLKKALQKLRTSLSSKLLLAGEVLWTPQKEGEILSEREILEDYPQLAKGMESFLVKKQD